MPLLAELFARTLRRGGRLLLEFVPKTDSQIRRLLAVRKDVHPDYTLEGMRRAFAGHFRELEHADIPESQRSLHLYEKL